MTVYEQPIRVIAIDPGYDRCGIAILQKTVGKKECLLFSTCIETNKKDVFNNRLYTVLSEVKKIIELYTPDFFAIEKLFFSNNKKTAMNISELKGALIYLAKTKNLPILELHPNQIKLAVTGDGKSDKSQMVKMIQFITGFTDKKRDDEYDAVAVGITFFALYRPGFTIFE
jgi:crossover junction endodeoxyribonuclease RuvC